MGARPGAFGITPHNSERTACRTRTAKQTDQQKRISGVAFHGLDLDDVIIHETLPAGIRGGCQLRD